MFQRTTDFCADVLGDAQLDIDELLIVSDIW